MALLGRNSHPIFLFLSANGWPGPGFLWCAPKTRLNPSTITLLSFKYFHVPNDENDDLNLKEADGVKSRLTCIPKIWVLTDGLNCKNPEISKLPRSRN